VANHSISESTVVGASKTNKKASKRWIAIDRLNILVEVRISAVTEATGITLKLLESSNGGEFHLVGDQSEVSLTSMTCASSSDIANATNTFTETTHGRITGSPVVFNAGTAAPTGLTDGDTFYIINVTANTFKLANSYERALEGNEVSISDDGTGNQVFFDARYEIRMVESDSSDAAQLPVSEYIALGVDTGSGDSITISTVLS